MFRKFKYIAEYVPVRLLDFFVGVLPRSVALKAGEELGLLLSVLLPKRRQLILTNLAKAFPEKSRDELQRIERGVWKNIGRVAAEFVQMQAVVTNFDQTVSVENLDLVDAGIKQGHGAILVGFHFANWEVSGVALMRLRNLVAIARPMKNPLVNAWVSRKRGSSEMNIISHRNAVKESLRALKKNRPVGILVDQNLYTGGVFVDFFGRPAATTPLPALLHARTGAPVIIGYIQREGGRFRLRLEKTEPLPDGSDEASILKTTQIISHHLERVIRREPENWFWIHNRWKRSPEAVAS